MLDFSNLKPYGTDQITYMGKVGFEGKTVKDVLKEIKDVVDQKGSYLMADDGEEWGINGPDFCGAWEICINGTPYLSCWGKGSTISPHKYDDIVVESLNVTGGGWYCHYNYNITISLPPPHGEEIVSNNEKVANLFEF